MKYLYNLKLYVNSLSIQTKASIAYMVASVLTKGVNFLTLPVYTRILTTSEMGVVTTFSSWYAILYVLVTVSLTSGSFNIGMMEYKKERDKYQSVCLSMSTVSALIFGIIYIICYKQINSITTLSTELMLLQILLFIFYPAVDIWYARQRYEYHYKSVVLMTLLTTIASVLIPIFCIIRSSKHNVSKLGTVRLFSQNSILIVIGICLFIYIQIKGKCIFNRKMNKFALSISLPLVIHSLAKNILDTSDRLMIAKLCGDSAAGIYGTVYTISMIGLIVWSAVNSALIPVIFEKLENKQFKDVGDLGIKILFFFGAISIAVTLIAPEILKVLTTPEYYEAVYMIPAVAAGIFMSALYGLYGDMLLYIKKTVNIMLATVLATIINIILNLFLIPKYGYMVAAYTTTISFIILAFVQGWMQRLVFQKEIIPMSKVIIISITVILGCLSCNFIYNNFTLRYFIIVFFILICILNKKKIKELIDGSGYYDKK